MSVLPPCTSFNCLFVLHSVRVYSGVPEVAAWKRILQYIPACTHFGLIVAVFGVLRVHSRSFSSRT